MHHPTRLFFPLSLRRPGDAANCFADSHNSRRGRRSFRSPNSTASYCKKGGHVRRKKALTPLTQQSGAARGKKLSASAAHEIEWRHTGKKVSASAAHQIPRRHGEKIERERRSRNSMASYEQKSERERRSLRSPDTTASWGEKLSASAAH